jgi:predicted O-methyltransferase YrrM
MGVVAKWFRVGGYLLRCWMCALPRILYRSTLSVVIDPRGALMFLHNVLDEVDLYGRDDVLGDATVSDMLQGDAEPRIIGPYHVTRSSDTRVLMELVSLAYLMQVAKPETVFEIGTFVGRTTRLFALNAPQGTRVFTLDLPQPQVSHRVGEDYLHSPEAAKVVQLAGDSRFFDYSPWHGKCDFVWVDACHDYPFVKADTQAALRLCRPGGWIGWHDYRHSKKFDGVTRVVQDLKTDHPGLRHIKGTTIALLQCEGSS